MDSHLTYDIHVEAINMLIVLLSTQMFFPISDSATQGNVFFDVILTKDFTAQCRPAQLVQVLLNRYILHPQPPSSPPSLLQSITSAACNDSRLLSIDLFTARLILYPLRYFFPDSGTPHNADRPALADKCVLLLLILVHRNDVDNAFKKSLCSFDDSSKLPCEVL